MGKARPGVAHDGGAKGAPATDAYVAGRQPAKRWVAHDPAKKLPYAKGDVAKAGADYYECAGAAGAAKEAAALACRASAPATGAAGWTKLDQAAAAAIKPTDEVKGADVPPLAERTVKALAYDATAPSAQGDVRADAGAYRSAWRCVQAACATAAAPTRAGGWKLLRQQAEVVAQKPVPVEAYAHEAGRAYPAAAKVVVGGASGAEGGRVYACRAAVAELCGRVDPRKGRRDAAGARLPEAEQPWAATADVAKSLGAEPKTEVRALPLALLLAEGSTARLREGDHFAYAGVAYQCEDPSLCGEAVGKLKALYAQDRAAVLAPPVTDAAGVVAPPARANLAKAIREALLQAGQGFKQSRAAPKGEAEWAGLDATDPDALVKAGKAVACDLLRAPADAALKADAAAATQTEHLFRKGDVYCDPATTPAKAWRCKDPLKCGELAADPTGPKTHGVADATAAPLKKAWSDKLKTPAVADAWEEVEAAALEGKLLVARPDAQAAQKAAGAAPTKAFDWAATTAAGATGTYEFAPAALALDRARLWKCVGTKASCQATQPSKDTDGKAWALTTLKGAAYTAAEAETLQPAVIECFAWADGYPVQAGDVLCDPAAPSKRAWTCLDATACPGSKPDVADAQRLRAVWALATEGMRVDATGARTEGLTQRFEQRPAPKEEGAPVQCQDWDDREAAAGDLGAKLTWCDRGRVFQCVEAPTETAADAATGRAATTTRPCCSAATRPAAGAKDGCWRQARQRGTVAKKSAAEADARWGPAPAAGKCAANAQFGAEGAQAGAGRAAGAPAAAWGAAATAGKPTKFGQLELKDGAACAEDAAWQARLRSASVTPRARLPAAETAWPWNVRVANGALAAAGLEKALAGIAYRHDADGKAQLLNVLGWFPGICGDRPATAAAVTRVDACRADVAGAVTFALAGEPEQAAWARARAADPAAAAGPALQWWQTAFATPADPACHAAAKAGVTAATCGQRAAGADAAGKAGSLVQDAAKAYYARGAGPLPLVGPADYGAFSKAATGSETAFAEAPEDVLTWGPPMPGTWQGERVGSLPVAVALWRYVTPAHAWLPSVHEVVTGMWAPRAHETAARLKSGDYCTAAALVVAMQALARPSDPNAAPWAAVTAAGGPGR
jgi:hypothetical protein